MNVRKQCRVKYIIQLFNYQFDSSERFFFPIRIACLNKWRYNCVESKVSSLPGIGYEIIFGLQSESTTATVGIPSFAASIIAWNGNWYLLQIYYKCLGV